MRDAGATGATSAAEDALRHEIERWAAGRGWNPRHPSVRVVVSAAIQHYSAGWTIEEICLAVTAELAPRSERSAAG